MIPLIVLLLSIETLPDGEARIRFTPERPVRITGGELVVELDEAVFGEITGFEVFSAAGDETAVATIEGRKARITFSSTAMGVIADRPLLTLRAKANATPSFDHVKVTTVAPWFSTGVSSLRVNVAEGPVPELVPREEFDSVPADGYQLQLPKQRLSAGEAGVFRTFVPGGVALRNPHPFAVDVLFQTTGTLRDVRTESSFRLAPGESRYEHVFLANGYARAYATADIEMGSLRKQIALTGQTTSVFAGPLTAVELKRIEYTGAPESLRFDWLVGTPAPRTQPVTLFPRDLPVLRGEFQLATSAPWLKAVADGLKINVSVETAGLVPGVYRGTVTATPVATQFFAAGAPAVMGAVLTVRSGKQRLSAATAEFGAFGFKMIKVPAEPLTTSIIPAMPNHWLTASVTAPGSVTIAANGHLLRPGVYAAHAVLRGSTFTHLQQVVSRVPGGVLIEAGSPVRFTAAEGVATQVVEERPLGFTGALEIAVRTDSGGNWLTVTRWQRGLLFRAEPVGLATGTYTAVVTLRSPTAAGPTEIPVALLVHPVSPDPPAPLIATPAALDLLATTDTIEQGRYVTVSSDLETEPPEWTITSIGNWFRRGSNLGPFPVLEIRYDPSRLRPGIYTGQLEARTSTQSVVVPVRLQVVAPQATQAKPYLGTILNAASWSEGPIAAGEHISIYGSWLAEISMDGFPLSSTMPVVPSQLTGRNEVTLRLAFGSQVTEYRLPLAEAAPGVYTLDQSGKGLAFVRNASGAGASVERGTVVWLLATGLKRDDVTVDVGGVQARAMNVFPFEEGVAGRDWIEFVVPADAPVGEVPVTVVSAGVRSQKDVTIYVE